MTEEKYPWMPCGRCDTGVYDPVPMLAGLEAFGCAPSKKIALRMAPMCKNNSAHICFGAKDWIAGVNFPLTEKTRQQIRRICD